jgi:hypothetical protein
MLFPLLALLWGGGLGVKNLRKEKPSSLFEAYAMYPTPYGGYYVQPAPPYPMFSQGAGIPLGPQQYGQYGPVPPMYSPYYAPQGYYQQPVYAQAPQMMLTERQAPPPPPPQIQLATAAVVSPAPMPAQVRQVPNVLTSTRVSLNENKPTKNPLKDALSEALSEASRQIDNANKQASSEFVSFDGIDYSSHRTTAAPLSFSGDTVPIDDHILNWRELVGLPSNNPIMETRMPKRLGESLVELRNNV